MQNVQFEQSSGRNISPQSNPIANEGCDDINNIINIVNNNNGS